MIIEIFRMVRYRTCDYTGEQIEPGTGIIYVKSNGTILNFKNKKAETLYQRGVDPREVEWTDVAKKIEQTQEDRLSVDERILEREEQEGEIQLSISTSDFNQYYVKLYQRYLSESEFTMKDVDDILQDSPEFKTPNEVEHDLIRIRKFIKQGDIKRNTVRDFAKTLSESIVADLPDGFFAQEPVDPHIFVDQILEQMLPSDEPESDTY